MFTGTRITYLYRCRPLYRNINSATILVHRTTVHMWRWFHGLVWKQGRPTTIPPLFWNSAWDNKELVISDSKGAANQSASKVQNRQTEKQRQTNCILRLGALRPFSFKLPLFGIFKLVSYSVCLRFSAFLLQKGIQDIFSVSVKSSRTKVLNTQNAFDHQCLKINCTISCGYQKGNDN